MKKTTSQPTVTPHKKAALRKPTSVTLDPAVLAQLDERGDNRSEQISGDLSRYYRLLAEVRPALRRERFSRAEMALILDACNGWMMDAASPSYLWMEVADAIRLNGLATKWYVAEPSDLIHRIRALSGLESIALADAITRWWQAVGKGDHARDPARALD